MHRYPRLANRALRHGCLPQAQRTRFAAQIEDTRRKGAVAVRLFGSKPGSDVPGNIFIANEQNELPNISQSALRETIDMIRRLIGYETYDVNLILIDDDEMRETNLETRGIDASTDILSFPFAEAVKPGKLEPPAFDVADYYCLGDILIDVPYVIRQSEKDKEDHRVDEERGVSGCMANVFDPEQRIRMLLVHGMLHLVGYDHEEEDEYREMVNLEEKILRDLRLMS